MVLSCFAKDRMKIIFLTGPPGIVKTTKITRLVTHCIGRGMRVDGILTREVRDKAIGIGLRIIDISTQKEGWLAGMDLSKNGP